MPKAYILFNTVPEAEDELLQELRNTKGVIAADSVYGIYDFVAIVEAESLEEIKEIITWKLRRLKDVKSSVTLMTVS